MKAAYSKMKKIIIAWRCVSDNNESYTFFRNYKDLQNEPKQKQTKKNNKKHQTNNQLQNNKTNKQTTKPHKKR